MTPHNEARAGDYATAVLLPGDPERAEWIAGTYFDKPRLVNSVRGALGFTGSYRGMPVSVQSTGIGGPSFTIYVHELMTFYGVRKAVRVGTCGGLQAEVKLRDVVIAESARMDFEVAFGMPARLPDRRLFDCAVATAGKGIFGHHAGPVVCSDVFYHPASLERFAQARAEGAIACDMETSALYGMAASFDARALSILTVVDNLISNEETARSERQALFADMCRLALDTLVDDAEA